MTAAAVEPSASVTCVDARTGVTFAVRATRVLADGSIATDSTTQSRLCVGTLNAVRSVAVSDAEGGAYVVWMEAAGEDCDLRLIRVNADGAIHQGWPEGGESVCAARGTQTHPTLSRAADGAIWVAWQDYRNPIRPAVYLARYTGSGELGAGFVVDGNRLADASVPQAEPRLIDAGFGTVRVMWEQGSARARDIHIQTLNAQGAPVASWPDTGKSLIHSESDERLLAVVSSGEGDYVAWLAEDGAAKTLRVSRFDESGNANALWQVGGRELASTMGELQLGGIAADSSGLYATWSVAEGDSGVGRLGHLTPSGSAAAGWSEGGLRLGASSTFVNEVSAPRAGLSGSVYAAWVAYDESSDAIPYAGRISSSGQAVEGWTLAGLRLAEDGGDSYRPRLLSAGDDAVVSWSNGGTAGTAAAFGANATINGPLPTLVQADAWPDGVDLAWSLTDSVNYGLRLERKIGEGEWASLATLSPSPDGKFAFADRTISAGTVQYRLQLFTPELEATMLPFELVVPASTPLALHRIALEGDHLVAAFSLPSREESRIEIFDVQGRRVLRQSFKVEHAGEHRRTLNLGESMRSGVYFARLTHSRETRNARVVIAR